MENGKIIKLNHSTKILYSLFNLFAPISFVCIVVCSLELYNSLASLASLISIFVGLFCFISNLKKYNRFLFISDKTITVCSGKVDHPKVISIVKSENVVPENMGRDLTVKYENKKIKLLHTYFSILGTICYVGPLVFIPILKNAYVTAYKMVELYNILPEMFKEAPRTPSKAEDIIINILAWGFVLLVSSVGVLGILLTPFYPYMNL